jgi:hypothetical protein
MGKPVVYTVHDVEPLQKRNAYLLAIYSFVVNALISGFIFLSESSKEAFLSRFPRTRTKERLQIALGPYRTQLLSDAEKLILRRRLIEESNQFIVGYIGSIKRYKNPHALCTLPRQLSDGRPVHLVVAGQIEASLDAEVKDILKSVAPAHTAILRHLDELEMNLLIQSVDAVFLPYSAGFNSGMAMLCLCNRTKIICSPLPMFLELEQRLGGAWLCTWNSDGKADIISSVRTACETAATASMSSQDEQMLSEFLSASSFEHSSRMIAEFYRTLRSF